MGSYYDSYVTKQAAKGGFHVGDRVRIKPEHRGKTYTAQQKRGGEWILKEFKTTNWVLRRPIDYKGVFTQGLLVNAHMIEKVEPKEPVSLMVTSPTGLKLHNPPIQSLPAKYKAAMPPSITPVHPTTWASDDPDIIVGAIVIVNDPHGVIPKGKLFMITKVYGITVDVMQLFTGKSYASGKSWLTVIPEKDLTITYLPQ